MRPDGQYQFPNSHDVAKYFGVSSDAVLRWLDEYDLASKTVARHSIELSRHSVDLQLNLENLTPEGVKGEIERILAEFDAAPQKRDPSRDGPIQ